MARQILRLALGVLTLCVLLAGRSGRAQTPDPVETALRRALYLPSARVSASALSAASVRPTGLMGVPLDVAVVERLLRTRLQDVQSQVLRDVLRGDLALLSECRPCRDMVDAVAALATRTMDADARSAALVTATLRAGLAFSFASLGAQGVLPTRCGAPPPAGYSVSEQAVARQVALANAAYRGLQRSTWVHTLGFRTDAPRDPVPASDSDCDLFAERVQHLADTVARFGSDLRAVARVVEAVDATAGSCREAARLGPFVELRAALLSLGEGDRRRLSLSALRELRGAFARARGELIQLPATGSPVDAGADNLPACVQSLQQFGATFDEVFGRMGADLEGDLTLDALERDLLSLLDPVSVWTTQVPRPVLAMIDVDRARLALAAWPAPVRVDPLMARLSTDRQAAALRTVARRVEALRERHRTMLESPDFVLARDLIVRLAHRQPLRRSDVVAMAARVRLLFDALLQPHQGDARWALALRLLDAVLDAVPQSLIEDDQAPGGLRFDVPGLVSTLAGEFAQQDRLGCYLRATVGAGYVLVSNGDLARPFYEELGVGYRWAFGNQRFLAGPHAVVSGLLYQIQPVGQAENPLFVGVGASVNLYRLLDVSANVGLLMDVRDHGQPPRVALTVGLQLPLLDYLQALTSGTGTDSQTTTRGAAAP